MRVLHVLDHSLPLHSGYSFRTAAILRAQQRLGIELRAITGPRHRAGSGSRDRVGSLEFHRTPVRPGGPPLLREWREIERFSQEIERVVARWRPDILHAHSPALCGEAALKVARRHAIPLVYEIRAFWEDAAVSNNGGARSPIKYNLTRALETRVARHADAIFTICEGLRDDLIARGIHGGKIGIMPNGVDLDALGTPAPRDEALARALDLGAGPVIGFIGSFYDYEGLDDLIAAMPHIRKRHPHARLLLVGGGPMEQALHAQARASGADEAIRFTGRVDHDQVDRYYALVDVLAYPRKRSRLTELVTPLKPLEAMAQGRLVAASDVGGHRELIAHGHTGILFAPDDPQACAAALCDLLDDPDSWADLRKRASQRVRTHHDWRNNATGYRKVYDDLLGESERQTGDAAALSEVRAA